MAGQQQAEDDEEEEEEAVAESTTKVRRTFHAEICPADDLSDEPKRRWVDGRKEAFAFSFLVGRTIDCRQHRLAEDKRRTSGWVLVFSPSHL